jgi:hypothetical protein
VRCDLSEAVGRWLPPFVLEPLSRSVGDDDTAAMVHPTLHAEHLSQFHLSKRFADPRASSHRISNSTTYDSLSWRRVAPPCSLLIPFHSRGHYSPSPIPIPTHTSSPRYHTREPPRSPTTAPPRRPSSSPPSSPARRPPTSLPPWPCCTALSRTRAGPCSSGRRQMSRSKKSGG